MRENTAPNRSIYLEVKSYFTLIYRPFRSIQALCREYGLPVSKHRGDDPAKKCEVGEGTHTNVRGVGGKRVGSILCCECCTDNDYEPTVSTRYKFIKE